MDISARSNGTTPVPKRTWQSTADASWCSMIKLVSDSYELYGHVLTDYGQPGVVYGGENWWFSLLSSLKGVKLANKEKFQDKKQMP